VNSVSEHLEFEPIRSDEDIAAHFEDLSVPALIAATVYITGDPSYLRTQIRPKRFIMNEFQGEMGEDEKAQLRSQALKAISSWRDAGCPLVPPLPETVIREIMDWIACEPVPADYAAMYVEEIDLAGQNPRAIPIEHPDKSSRVEAPTAIVIGCGESGLLAAIRLKEAGIDFEILEKHFDVGGTWLENRYPGCRVDVASHYYSYSFGPSDAFSEYYAQQPELYRYFRRLFDRHEINHHVNWGCEVTRAVWDDESAQWHVTFRNRNGAEEVRSAHVIISGVGILSRPLIPDLPGRNDFRGPIFHSAQWDQSVDLQGKRVALIGAGASGFQIGPAIVDQVKELVVFQRTPQWMAPNARYHAGLKSGEQWAMRHLPSYAQWFRFMLMWQSSDTILEMVRIDPDWPDFPRTANAFSSQRRELFVRWIEDIIGDDPDLLAKVTPTYPPMTKRMLQDNGSWLRCLRRSHVTLVTDEIAGIDESGVRTAHASYDADVIVLATGFRASEVLHPMEIVGRNGRSIADTWQARPAAYRGVSVPGFPNFFMLGGPGTGLAHAGSVIFTTECQMRYVGDALRILLDGSCRWIEPTQKAYESYQNELQAEVATLMWGHPSIEHSWYKAADGHVYVLCPWRLVDYWKMTANVDPDDHLVG
jgi:4-hydroxyacetophenone monooxygenase